MFRYKSKLNFYKWLAGFIDGEGCIGVHRRKGNCPTGPTLTISNTNGRLLKEIKSNLGFGNFRKRFKKNPKHKNSHTLGVVGINCQLILKKIFPYLRGKKKQAELVLRMTLNSKEHQTRRLPENEKRLRRMISKKLLKLNKKGK
jgi:hypothetical protein